MNAKLTLSLNKNVIESAKDYAKANNISLSKLIESYLDPLLTNDERGNKITPLVESLTGIISEQPDENSKEDYYEYLSKKYS